MPIPQVKLKPRITNAAQGPQLVEIESWLGRVIKISSAQANHNPTLGQTGYLICYTSPDDQNYFYESYVYGPACDFIDTHKHWGRFLKWPAGLTVLVGTECGAIVFTQA